MKPRIGITCLHDWGKDVMRQNHTYVRAITKAGGVPFLLPAVSELDVIEGMVSGVDGILISGGPDMGAHFFGEEPLKNLGMISPLMDSFEMELIKLALEKRMPILGICRGEQVLNVAMGGTLYQDIYSQCSDCLQHRQSAPREFTAHTVKLNQDSRLATWLGSDIRVNTFHHQAIKNVAPGLKVVGYAPDGIIEAVEAEDENLFIVGVQWHPEGMWNSDYNYDNLFNEFIRASESY